MFTFILEMLGMNQLLNWFILTIPSLSVMLSECISKQKNISKSATSSSPTDRAQIISKDYLLSTSALS